MRNALRRSSMQSTALVAACFAGAAPLSAAAQSADDPVAGRQSYMTAANSGSVTCVGCHGDVGNRRAQIDPQGDLDFDLVLARFLAAISSQPDMRSYETSLTTQQKRNVAAYIADVPKAAPNPAAFPATAVNAESAAMTVRFRNAVTASASLTLTSFGLAGANPAEFVIKPAGTTCANSQTLAAGAGCDVSVALRPASAGNKSALLAFTFMQSGASVVRSAQLTGSTTSSAPPAPVAGGGGSIAPWLPWLLLPAALGWRASREQGLPPAGPV